MRKAHAGSRVTLAWTHSVERTPWIERYVVSKRGFDLREVNVQSLGSGVELVAPIVRTADGWVTMRGMDKSFPTLRFIQSSLADRRLTIDDGDIDPGERIADGASVQVRVRSAPRLLTWMIKE